MLDMVQQLLDAALGEAPIERVIITGMAFWIVMSQRHVNKIQEKRVDMAVNVTQAVTTFTSALERNTETLKSFVVEE